MAGENAPLRTTTKIGFETGLCPSSIKGAPLTLIRAHGTQNLMQAHSAPTLVNLQILNKEGPSFASS